MTDAYKQGYDDYYAGVEGFECPYDEATEYEFWSRWCDGHMDAYCEDEGK